LHGGNIFIKAQGLHRRATQAYSSQWCARRVLALPVSNAGEPRFHLGILLHYDRDILPWIEVSMSEHRRDARCDDEVLAQLGELNSRRLIATPALVCELSLLVANIDAMAHHARTAGVNLRPHVKSHKSAAIAQRQLDAGAVGLSFAKLGEAEVIVERLNAAGDGRLISVLLTSPLVGRHCAERAAQLAAHCDLIVATDHRDGVDELEAAALAYDTTISVLCDVDVGLGRTGVLGPAEALALAERVSVATHLHFRGVQGYGGHLQHISGRERRREATHVSTERLRVVIDALDAAGFNVAIRSGGGTGTLGLDVEIGVLNELQPGSYVFMDREYRDALGDDPEGRFEQSLTLVTTVISANHDGYVTVDAGLKSMATDAGAPLVIGHETSATYQFYGDEQGMVAYPVGHAFRRGERLELVPPHCDPTVDRYDVIWLVHDDVVLDVLDVTARGRSQ
jgi:D-serine deaminase-like pyridoxal phosphate-dependent protein